MVLILKPHRIAYFPVPKNANTSIKEGFREAFSDTDLTITSNLRMSARLRAMAEDCDRVAVVREPMQRALSGYGNRVVHHRDLERSAITRIALRILGLPLRPTPDAFFAHLKTYMAVNDRIRRHFLPQRAYLGADLGYFHALYRIDELDRLAADIEQRTGTPIAFGRHQTGGPKLGVDDVSDTTRARIRSFYAEDFALLSGFFN
ncbi:MAG: sulfotransferase family 2 domain-containing protein [Rhizobiaceae bacterium]